MIVLSLKGDDSNPIPFHSIHYFVSGSGCRGRLLHMPGLGRGKMGESACKARPRCFRGARRSAIYLASSAFVLSGEILLIAADVDYSGVYQLLHQVNTTAPKLTPRAGL